MQFFDTHCHIQSAGLSEGERSTRELWAKLEGVNVKNLVNEANNVGVNQMILVGCDVQDSEIAVSAANEYESTFASIGIHPHEAQRYVDDESAKQQFTRLVSRPKVIAVGECGLDYFYEHSPKEAQIAMLHFQLNLAQQHGLPVIFHVREALDDFWPIYDAYKVPGVLHSFTDSKENLDKAVERGLYIGVNGIATFSKRSSQLEMYRSIPLENLVLETDAPFLTPVPFRGKICKPKHVALTAEFMANLRNISLSDIADMTTRNARNLFKV